MTPGKTKLHLYAPLSFLVNLRALIPMSWNRFLAFFLFAVLASAMATSLSIGGYGEFKPVTDELKAIFHTDEVRI
jgi:hypothetical protein